MSCNLSFHPGDSHGARYGMYVCVVTIGSAPTRKYISFLQSEARGQPEGWILTYKHRGPTIQSFSLADPPKLQTSRLTTRRHGSQ